MNLEEELLHLKNEAIGFIASASNLRELEKIKVKYLGRKGQFNLILKRLPQLSLNEKVLAGKVANEVKNILTEAITSARERIINLSVKKKERKKIDITASGIRPNQGHLHLITQTIEEIASIFERIGFVRVRYPEIEWDWYAFEGLNMPKNHPARDEWETFFVSGLESKKYGEAVLTPHTSSGQLREMGRVKKPPIRMLNIAKCYRRQSDVSHAPMFYQFEGLVVDKDISIVHLKGTLDYFAKQYFGPERQTRIRPFHFQFTEPSFEFDVTCIVCNGKGCRVCKEGWMELGGSGMVHPAVLKNGGIDPKKYSGFAWGWGVERLFMMKYAIDDIRILFTGDLRFLYQF